MCVCVCVCVCVSVRESVCMYIYIKSLFIYCDIQYYENSSSMSA